MKIPGYITAPLLTGAVLGATLGLFTVLPINPTGKNTSEENISGKNESLELSLKGLGDGDGELLLKVTGRNTTVVVQSFLRMLNSMDGYRLTERSYLSIKRLENVTTKRPVSSF